jgi:hypothetical protein
VPIYTRSIAPTARRDLGRILAGCSPSQAEVIRHCSQTLFGMLRYDPDRLGIPGGAKEERRAFAWGMLRVLFTVSPEDRLVRLEGISLNVNWQP